MRELLDFGNKIMQSQSFSRMLGTKLVRFEKGIAVVELIIKREHKQQHGFVHGGVLSYLADNCLTFAGGSILGDSVTSEYKINYVRPAIGEKLVASATILHAGKNQAVCKCEVIAVNKGTEKTVAFALGTINKV